MSEQYPYGASYYAQALEAIKRQILASDGSMNTLSAIERIVDETLEGIWDESEETPSE